METKQQGRADGQTQVAYLDIAGWRVVERLPAAGSFSRYLAVAREHVAVEESEWLAGESVQRRRSVADVAPEVVELIVEPLTERVTSARVGVIELSSAFDRIDAPCVPQVIDVGQGENGERVVVVEAALGSSLAELLERPRPLEPGEMVTVLAALVETIRELHGTGLSLGTLRLEGIVLTALGRPIICEWGHTTRLSEDSGRAATARGRDWRALDAVADLMLGVLACGTSVPAALEDEFDRCLAGTVDDALPERLLDALFNWSDAQAIDDPAAELAERPRRAIIADPKRSEDDGVPAETAPILARDARGQPLFDERNTERRLWPEEQDTAAVRASRRRRRTRRGPLAGIRAAVASVGVPFRVVGAAAIVMASCAMVLAMGDGDRAPQQGAASTVSITAEPMSPAPGTDSSANSSSVEHSASPDALAPGSTANAVPEWRTAAASEDPSAAAVALLAQRSACLSSAAPDCLDEVYQPDAPGLHADLLRGEGGDSGLTAFTVPTLRDRHGDIAVIDLWPADAVQMAETPPASLTIARGEAGWRLRDVRVAGR